MRPIFKLVLLPACALPLLAIDGVVTNATTGMPQAGVAINLVQPSQNGMVPLGETKTDAQGQFKIDKTIPPGPGLLQATYEGTTYNQIITPGMPTTSIQVKVYDATKDPIVATPIEHLILMEPSESEIKVSETVVFNNQTIRTFNDPVKGSLQVYLPEAAAGKARAIITAPGGMPIPRTPIKADGGFYKIDYPIKPGETRMDVAYTVPAAQNFTGKVVPLPGGVHLVTPFSVTLTGEGIESQGQEPQTQAHIYLIKGADYKVSIDGVGALRPETPATSSGAGNDPNAAAEDTGSPKIEIASARIYSRLYWVLGLALGILAVGGAMLYRRGTA